MSKTMELELDIGSATDTGKVRDHNEDSFAFVRFDGADLLVVCDGMGGHAAGEVASRLAWRTIVSEVMERGKEPGDPRELVFKAIVKCHHAVREAAAASPERRGMGTTCVVAFVQKGALYLGHVGDSRAYVVRGGVATQETVDQTKVQRMLEANILTEEEAKKHPDAGVLSQAIGQTKEVVPFVTPDEKGLPLSPGDAIVLCTDGAYDCMSLEQIAAHVSAQNAHHAATSIVRDAVSRDGNDNATAIVALIRPRRGTRITERPGPSMEPVFPKVTTTFPFSARPDSVPQSAGTLPAGLPPPRTPSPLNPPQVPAWKRWLPFAVLGAACLGGIGFGVAWSRDFFSTAPAASGSALVPSKDAGTRVDAVAVAPIPAVPGTTAPRPVLTAPTPPVLVPECNREGFKANANVNVNDRMDLRFHNCKLVVVDMHREGSIDMDIDTVTSTSVVACRYSREAPRRFALPNHDFGHRLVLKAADGAPCQLLVAPSK